MLKKQKDEVMIFQFGKILMFKNFVSVEALASSI
jgi:hypothetical protein